jgi:hypothetical protein
MLQRFSLAAKTGIGRSNSEETGIFHGHSGFPKFLKTAKSVHGRFNFLPASSECCVTSVADSIIKELLLNYHQHNYLVAFVLHQITEQYVSIKVCSSSGHHITRTYK